MAKSNYIIFVFILFFASGCKHKGDNACKASSNQLQPFVEKFGYFQCQNNNEYTYIFRKKNQIDSLDPVCFLAAPVAFPIPETDIVYIMFGKMSYHYDDTFSETHILKDTCNKRLIYEVNMLQRDTALWSNGGGVLSMFCAVENIPADYQVEVKYKYVPIQ